LTSEAGTPKPALGATKLGKAPPKKIVKTEHLGCYKDNRNRALAKMIGSNFEVEDCAEAAIKDGYNMIGL
jgi:hypothetical protein